MERLTRRGIVLGGAAALAGCDQLAAELALAAPEAPVAPSLAPLDGAERHYSSGSDRGISLPAIDLEALPGHLRRQRVRSPYAVPAGTVIVDTPGRFLYLQEPEGAAIRYGVSVGREGFVFDGTGVIARTARWPRWTPPPEMIERDPSLERWREGMPGGRRNPLGARALYIYQGGRDTLYRVHGTPEWRSIGRAASSGCIRMINQDVIDLHGRVPRGAPILVLPDTPPAEMSDEA